jgi:hypothetical protein
MKNILFNIKKYKVNLVAAFLSVIFISCTDQVLDKGPLASFSAENIWTDSYLIDAFMADMYNTAQLIPSGEHFRTRQNTTTFALTSLSDQGRFRANATSNTGYFHADGRTSGTSTAHVLQIWDDHYEYLRNLNLAIEAFSDTESTLDETYREERLGELYFFRAHAYFNMVKRYGGVPIIKEPQDVSLSFEELQVPRSTEEEVYDFIAEDLDLAIELLEDKDMHMSRISHWAALVIKSRAMLYAGSIAANNDKLPYPDDNGLVGIDPSQADRFYEASMEASKQLLPAPYGLGTSPFTLMPGSTTAEYRKIFAEAGEDGNTESIMIMQYTGEESLSNEYDFYLLPRASVDHVTWGSAVDCYIETTTWFDYLDGTPGDQLPPDYPNNGSNLFLDNLESGTFHNLDQLWGNKDPRFEACIAIPGMMVGDNVSYSHDKVVDASAAAAAGVPSVGPNQNHINSALHIYKPARPEDPAIVVLTGTASINIYRISEIYLNYVEAAFGLGQDVTALAALNEIRTRVGMPLITNLTMDAIMQERKVELFFERHRYWDLKRWREASAPLSTNYNGVDFTFDVANDNYEFRINANSEKIQRQFNDEHYYLPIPLSEINTNDVIVQNPGY